MILNADIKVMLTKYYVLEWSRHPNFNITQLKLPTVNTKRIFKDMFRNPWGQRIELAQLL